MFTAICHTDKNTNKCIKIADLPDTYYINRDNMEKVLANAALIAAAPEMYAMLETLQADYEENSVVHGKIAHLLKKARDKE